MSINYTIDATIVYVPLRSYSVFEMIDQLSNQYLLKELKINGLPGYLCPSGGLLDMIDQVSNEYLLNTVIYHIYIKYYLRFIPTIPIPVVMNTLFSFSLSLIGLPCYLLRSPLCFFCLRASLLCLAALSIYNSDSFP